MSRSSAAPASCSPNSSPASGSPWTTCTSRTFVKCRPPGDRDPQPDEIAACAPWLDRQLELIRPKVIVTLGNFATKLLLETKDGITKIRGQEFGFAAGQRAVLIPTLHPSAVLRSGGKALAEARADFVHVKRALVAAS